MSAPQNFRDALTCVYLQNPCEVLPNALWKSMQWVDEFETDFTIEDGIIRQLKAWNPAKLMHFWDRDRRTPKQLHWISDGDLDFALIHQDFLDSVCLGKFSHRNSYFRMIHKNKALPDRNPSAKYSFAIADPVSEAIHISNFIAACYDDIHPSPEDVMSWCEYPVFRPDLWVWIIDEAKDRPAGLGIAEFDPVIAEGSLEWIQVLPEYRSRGFGKQIVCELLRRLDGWAAFITVSGQVDQQNQAEMLYRSCGFEGQDLWWVLRK